MTFIDCNASIGEVLYNKFPLVNPTLDNQLSLMRRYGISRALCSSGFCLPFDIDYGNELMSQWGREYRGILPVFTAAPESFTPFNNAKAMKIYPKIMNYCLSSLHVGGICAQAAEKNLPVLLQFGQTDMRELMALLSDFPGVNFIVTEFYYRNLRNLCPLLENYKNFYVEISFLKTFGALEFLCERFGAGRLVFGTGSPYYGAGASIAMVLCAEISQDDKELIAHGNIELLCHLEVSDHDD